MGPTVPQVTPSPSVKGTAKAFRQERAKLIVAAIQETIESNVHNMCWMTLETLVHHLNDRYDFKGDRFGVDDLALDSVTVKRAIDKFFNNCTMLVDGVVRSGLYSLIRWFERKPYQLYFMCQPGARLPIVPANRDAEAWLKLIETASDPRQSSGSSSVQTRTAAKRQRIQTTTDIRLECMQTGILTERSKLSGRNVSPDKESNPPERRDETMPFQSPFDDPLVRRLFGVKDGEDVEDNIYEKLRVLKECQLGRSTTKDENFSSHRQMHWTPQSESQRR